MRLLANILLIAYQSTAPLTKPDFGKSWPEAVWIVRSVQREHFPRGLTGFATNLFIIGERLILGAPARDCRPNQTVFLAALFDLESILCS